MLVIEAAHQSMKVYCGQCRAMQLLHFAAAPLAGETLNDPLL
jgi:hypothetical protein